MNSVHSASGSIPVEDGSGIMGRPSAGQVVRIVYPFVRDTYTQFDEEGGVTVPTWRPGVRYEVCGPYGEDAEAVADGEGEAEFTVVDTFKPGRFPERVFLTRRFVNPDGKTFGKGKLHIWTLEKLRRLSRGFQVPYRLADTTHDR